MRINSMWLCNIFQPNTLVGMANDLSTAINDKPVTAESFTPPNFADVCKLRKLFHDVTGQLEHMKGQAFVIEYVIFPND